MLQSGEISSIMPIDSAWTGSVISIPDIAPSVPQTGMFSETEVGIFTLALLLVLLILGKKIVSSIPGILSFVFSPPDRHKASENQKASKVLNVIFIIICPVFISMGERYQIFNDDYITKWTPGQNFIFILGILFLIFLLRSFLLYITGSVTKKSELFSTIGKTTIFFFCCAALVSILPLPLTYLISNPDFRIFRIVICSLLGLIFFIYLLYVGKIILSSGVSHFFCFLYLCTLEVLPVSLIVGTLVKI